MDDITEKILQALRTSDRGLSPAQMAAAVDNQSACDIDRQRLNRIRQTLMQMVDDGRLVFDPDDPQCFRLKP